MDKKLSVWQGVLIGSIITPICLHLQYPMNLIAMVIAFLLIIASFIKDRKKYNKFNYLGMFSVFIGFIVGIMMITGKLTNFSLFAQMLGSMGMLFLGILLIGVGNHITNPERVPKKVLYYGTAYICVLFGFYWILFYW